ncbi:MAG: isochorismatase family protein [Bdellovibrionales bacterium]|nr:isochorismatase family protein [Bdellovibrionales bacterium]
MRDFRSLEFTIGSILLGLALAGPQAGFADGNGAANVGPRRSALVIIDMQEPFVTRGGSADREENLRIVRELRAAQVAAIEAARRAAMPIVFVEYQDFGATDPALRAAAAGYPNSTTVIKNYDGVFDDPTSNRQIREFLSHHNVRNLVITGANGGACVEASISGALSAGYDVTAFSRGIADFNYEDFIYPYVGQYHFSADHFREVDTLDAAVPAPPSSPAVSAIIAAHERRVRRAVLNSVSELDGGAIPCEPPAPGQAVQSLQHETMHVLENVGGL